MSHKTLLIVGTAKVVETGKIHYNLTLYGQSNEDKRMIYIRQVKPIVKCYPEMIDFCKNVYSSYFNTDLFNIVTLEQLTLL